MSNKIDLTGKRFGYLLVLKEASQRMYKEKRISYEVRCDCGIVKTVSNKVLTGGHSRSCGCLGHPKGKNSTTFKGYKDISIKYFNRVKNRANERNQKFDITIEDMGDLLENQNYTCALSGLFIQMDGEKHTTASLDKIENSKGYVKGNIQWLHKDINNLKSDIKQEKLLELCSSITKHNKLGV
jgi:hypothetical protein